MTSLMFGADRERRRIGGSTHLIADVAVIFAFAMAPLMLPLERASSAVSLALALAHAALTVLIARPARRSRDGLATLHAGTEVAVGILLCVAALLVPWGRASRLFFGSTGAAILIVWWLTDYRTVAAPAPMAGRE
jgi:hypothetical protein